MFSPRLNVENDSVQQMLALANRIAEQVRAGRWAAFQARQSAWLVRAEMSRQLDEFGKEQGFRKKYVATMLPQILAGAIDHARAEMGNIQVCGVGGLLQICAQRGFDNAFLEFFGSGYRGQTACTLAQRNAEVVMVRDVTDTAIFDCSLTVETLLDAGVRSVLSMPLLSKSGRVIGILSTHSRRVKAPTAAELKRIAHFAGWVAALLEWRDRPTPPPVI